MRSFFAFPLNPPDATANQVLIVGADGVSAGQSLRTINGQSLLGSTNLVVGSSLTVREVDGSPSGVATEIVFPNGTVSLASGVATIAMPFLPIGGGTLQGSLTIIDGSLDMGNEDIANVGSLTAQFISVAEIEVDGVGVVTTDDSRLSNARTPTAHNHPISDVTSLQTSLDAKQATLVSGTTIKTVNSESLLGSGNIIVGGSTDASTLTSGTLDDARLSANVAMRNAANTFTGTQTVGAVGSETRITDAGFALTRSVDNNINASILRGPGSGTNQISFAYEAPAGHYFTQSGNVRATISSAILPNTGGILSVNQVACNNYIGAANVPLTITNDDAAVTPSGTILNRTSRSASGANAIVQFRWNNIERGRMRTDGRLVVDQFQTSTLTVATLPAAAGNAGLEINVSDSSVTTFGSIVAGGGASNVKVRSNGTNWTVQGA